LKCRQSRNFVEIFWPQKWDCGRKATFLMSGCHLPRAVMTDRVLGISCFLFSFLFIEVNKQLNTCVQLDSHICTLCILFELLYNTNVHWFTNKTAFTATAVTWQVGYSIFKILLGRKEEGWKRDGQMRDGQTTDRFSPGGACFAMPKNVNIRPFGHIWGFWTCFQYFLVYLALIWISVFLSTLWRGLSIYNVSPIWAIWDLPPVSQC